MTEFSQQFKAAMKAAGLNYTQAARRLGVSSAEVSQWATGTRTPLPERQSLLIEGVAAPAASPIPALVAALQRDMTDRLAKFAIDLEAATDTAATPDPRPVAEAFGKAGAASAAPSRQRVRKG